MVERKQILFIADSLDNAHKFHQVLSGLNVDVTASSGMQMERMVNSGKEWSLVIYEVHSNASDELATVERALAEHSNTAILLIVREDSMSDLALSARMKCDFVMATATEAECLVRIRRLLRLENGNSASDLIVFDSMVINLATYQVRVAGKPVDFTYLEYALLAFLVTHSGRTYSRDALLRHVWGFDYYGGSRTVDVHVRRVRAKLGPELAQHLETVRGVGYLWE